MHEQISRSPVEGHVLRITRDMTKEEVVNDLKNIDQAIKDAENRLKWAKDAKARIAAAVQQK